MATALQTRKSLKRSAIKRKKHRRSRLRGKWTNGDWCKECDKVFQQILYGSCAVCDSLPPHQRINATRFGVHHLISRSRKFFRHTLTNGICLCSHHHILDPNLSAHGAPWAFEAWLKKWKPKQHQWWLKNRNECYPSLNINYQQVHDVLLAKLEARGEGETDGLEPKP